MKLVEEVDGIDVLLSGHTHNRVYEAMVVNDAVDALKQYLAKHIKVSAELRGSISR